MFDASATPADMAPPALEWRHPSGTPVSAYEARAMVQRPTDFLTLPVHRLGAPPVAGRATGAVDDGAYEQAGALAPAEGVVPSDVEKAAAGRRVLLGKKHGPGARFGREEESRLEILTRRLRAMSPVVDEATIGANEKMVDELGEIAARIAKARAELDAL